MISRDCSEGCVKCIYQVHGRCGEIGGGSLFISRHYRKPSFPLWIEKAEKAKGNEDKTYFFQLA